MFKSLFRVVAGASVCMCAMAIGQESIANTNECEREARHVLGKAARVMRNGDFLHTGHQQCLAVVPYESSKPITSVRVRRGFIRQRNGATWHELLRFDGNISNPRGYVGVDVIDVKANFGFSVETWEKRSDGTPGFTLYLTYLNSNLEPEGVPVEVSWNSKVGRFQEYAVNGLDPPGFKPEIPNPPIVEILKGAPRHPAPQPPK